MNSNCARKKSAFSFPSALAQEQPLIVSTKKINPKLFPYANEPSCVQVEE